MDILIISIFVLSIIVYYIYAKIRSRENRVLIKFQTIQLLCVKEAAVSVEDLLVELNDVRQPDEIKLKLLQKVVYEMVEQGTMLINKDLHVRLHPQIFDTSSVKTKKS